MSSAPKSGTAEIFELRELLPPILWRALARNDIHTFEQAKASYPEQLLLMPHIGVRRFRMIEKALFPGRFYAPITGEVEHDMLYAAQIGTMLRRAQGELYRQDVKAAERNKQP